MLWGAVESKLDFAFSLYDKDGDGFITQDEFLEMVLALYKTMELDTCQPNENTSEQKARQLFRKMDFSMNEDISKEEIFHAMINDPAIVRFIK